MPPVRTIEIGEDEVKKLLSLSEGHFCDLKSTGIKPAKLTQSLSAFANADGGEVYVGIDEDTARKTREWCGFSDPEAANPFLQVFEEFFPLGSDFSCEFLQNDSTQGLVLKVELAKTREIKTASNGTIYVRRGAQNLPLSDSEAIKRLEHDKGLASFETQPINTDPTAITNSETIISFMLNVVPDSEPEPWLRKQQVLVEGKPTVAGIVLFADEPQAMVPKHCGIKIYRYATRDSEGTREALCFDPVSIEGCAYEQVHSAVGETQRIIESVRVNTPRGLEQVNYPVAAVHEIVTNAVLHRDYSIADDIHVRIFDNRVEVASPGTLPGHITEENILQERFARNGIIVRLINKFPNPPNKDVGEGLNTAFNAMRQMKLKDPVISQVGGYVTVTLRHEPMATPEETILEYLQSHDQIRNSEAREICFIGSENKMKRILQAMVRKGLLEPVPGRTRYTAAYRLKLSSGEGD